MVQRSIKFVRRIGVEGNNIISQSPPRSESRFFRIGGVGILARRSRIFGVSCGYLLAILGTAQPHSLARRLPQSMAYGLARSPCSALHDISVTLIVSNTGERIAPPSPTLPKL